MCSPGLCILRIKRELFTVLNYCVTTLSGISFFLFFFTHLLGRTPTDLFSVESHLLSASPSELATLQALLGLPERGPLQRRSNNWLQVLHYSLYNSRTGGPLLR